MTYSSEYTSRSRRESWKGRQSFCITHGGYEVTPGGDKEDLAMAQK